MSIHSTAIIHEGASLGEGTEVGPYSVIGSKVKLGKNNIIKSHVVIEGNTEIGDENTFFQFASVGAAPQDLKFHGEDSKLIIGNKNTIREYVTLQPGTEGGGMLTSIGDQNLFMASSHVGHDCKVGNANVIANSVALAGHVTIHDFVIMGGLSAVHQFVRIGDSSMISGGSMVIKDIPPFSIAQGDRASLVGINKIGLERRGFSKEDIEEIQKAFRGIFVSNGIFTENFKKVKKEVNADSAANQIIDFINSSERGICSYRKKSD